MNADLFFQKFDLLADAPGAVAKLRELVLELAVQGKLVDQKHDEGRATQLIAAIEAERNARAGKLRKPEALLSTNRSDHLFEIPASWAWTKLGNIALKIQYGYTASADTLTTEIRMLRITDIQDNRVNWPSVPGCQIGEDEAEKYLLRVNDILIARTGGTIGKSFIVTDAPVKSVFASYLIRVTPAQSMDARYVKIFLGCPFYWIQLRKMSAGTGQPNVNGQALGRLEIPLPPLAEQKRIVAKVDELMALCDRLEARHKERDERHAALSRAALARFADAPTPDNLALLFHPDFPTPTADLRKTILSLAVQGKLTPQDPNDSEVPSVEEFRKAIAILANSLGLRLPKESAENAEQIFEVPSSWKWMSLAEIGVSQTGTTPDKNDHTAFNGEIPFIKPADIFPDTIDYSNESLTREGAENGSRLAPPGSLLMVCIGTIGKCNLIERECSFNQQINSLSPVEWVAPQYLLTAVRASYFQEEAWAKSSSTTISIINKSRWVSIPVPIPPLAEQHRIVAQVDKLMALVDRLEASLEIACNTATALIATATTELTTKE